MSGVGCGPATPRAAPAQVCEAAGVELRVVPLTEQYWQRVVSHCLAEIRAGRTPNPDMLCNSRRALRRVQLLAALDCTFWAAALLFWEIIQGFWSAFHCMGSTAWRH
jgi:tRNA U34 2-thiouridine synthase MnmA/TrmU